MFCLLQAVDSERRSGHGRVVYMYYELCEKLWGGSPATEQTEMGLETDEVNQQADVRETADYNDTEEQTEPSNNTSSQCSSGESSLLQKIPLSTNDRKCWTKLCQLQT